MKYQQIKIRIDRTISLDFSDLLYQCFDLFKKVWLQGLLLQVIVLMVSMALMLVFYIPMMLGVFVTGGFEPDGSDLNSGAGILLLIGICMLYVAIIIGLVFTQIALQGAFYRICRMKDRGYNSQPGIGFGMFLRKEYFKKILIVVFAQVGISLAAALLCILPIFYVAIPLQFVIIMFAFHPNLTVNQLLDLSFKLGTKKWFITFGILLVLGALTAVGGFVTCGLGFYVLSSIVNLAFYVIYKEVIGFHEDEEVIASLGQ